MKKKKCLFIFILGCSLLCSTVYALSFGFKFDSQQLSFSSNSRNSKIMNSFDNKYNLNVSIDEASSDEKEIQELSRKVTFLLLGGFNNVDESSEDFYNRKQEYYNMASYKYYPKDSNTSSGYDESNDSYRYVIASTLAIPQLFNTYNELGIIYNSFGDIRVTTSNDLVISTVVLPNVVMKEEDENNSQNYNLITTNLINTYYFLKIDGVYRLTYLYGETTDELNEYFNQVEDQENISKMSIANSYDSKLSNLYNFSKINELNEAAINKAHDDNLGNILFLRSIYNNRVVTSGNGVFICDGLVLTSWKFLEKSLKEAQYFTIKDGRGNEFNLDGIVTVDIDNDIAILKVKENSGTYIKFGDSKKLNVEDAIVVMSSKTGVGLSVQKGIVIKAGDYIETSIPLSGVDVGSPLFNSSLEVIGISNSKSINSTISVALSSKTLLEIQKKFSEYEFDSIKTISFNKMKEEFFYNKTNAESIKNSIPKSKWRKFKKIGDIEDSVKLELVKASYEDNIVSLRYKNSISDYISSMSQATTFISKLRDSGYENVLNTNDKVIYKNKNYKVIIRDEGDYLIIVMVKL